VKKQLSRDARMAWDELVRVTFEEKSISNVYKALERIRHKISFHYDAGEIFSGYNKHFFEHFASERAFVSMGESMSQSRFYFADAAVDGYIASRMGKDKVQLLTKELENIIPKLNISLYLIVTRFIQKRGFGFRNYREENT
ncbi:hypothetical protein ACFL6K_05375, partial [Candidatus Latescibacterota bacterium]